MHESALETDLVPHAPEPVLLQTHSPASPAARQVLHAYLQEVAGRYYGRPATEAEMDDALSAHPDDDLQPPSGLLVLALSGGAVLGCAGSRLITPDVAELTRVFVDPAARGRGVGAQLVGEVERLAHVHGRTQLRLDTRSDLVEARRLYARLGYREVPAFNDDRYAEHWFAKDLV